MLRVGKAKVVGNFGDGFASGEEAFCFLQDKPMDVVDGGIACVSSHQITQIACRHAELVCAIGNGGQTRLERILLRIIGFKNRMESLQGICVCYLSRQELPLIESFAIVQQQADIVHDDRILHSVTVAFQRLLDPSHVGGKNLQFLGGGV